MQNEFVKETKIAQKTNKEQEKDLVRSIIKTKLELENSSKNFEYAEDEMIDYYTYQIKANQAKLDYLVRKAKSNKIMIDMVNAIKLELFEDQAI